MPMPTKNGGRRPGAGRPKHIKLDPEDDDFWERLGEVIDCKVGTAIQRLVLKQKSPQDILGFLKVVPGIMKFFHSEKPQLTEVKTDAQIDISAIMKELLKDEPSPITLDGDDVPDPREHELFDEDEEEGTERDYNTTRGTDE